MYHLTAKALYLPQYLNWHRSLLAKILPDFVQVGASWRVCALVTDIVCKKKSASRTQRTLKAQPTMHLPYMSVPQ